MKLPDLRAQTMIYLFTQAKFVFRTNQALTISDERVGGYLLLLGQRVGGTLFGWEESKIRGQ
jgi:hypothetical protein